ncbi:DUF3267 domain-containing protein [Paratractidigestivibacter sp.]|uniref:DUF3267 domain-containing protein n=1 Tax=Paratractidigestivibacter sp. TaxID=2847316 RepID=UPI002ABDC829|nr:DUF3267 domain-containing protein [Paratractidigestivibacter sp.]
MTELAKIDILGDKSLQRRMVHASLVPLAAGAAAVALLFAAGAAERPSLAWLAALVALALTVLPAHELVHAAAFKLLVAGCRVSFEARSWCVATNAHGALMGRGAALAVLLSPLVLVTLALACGCASAGCPALAVAEAALHASGCAGDALMAAEVLRERSCTHVRDTDYGIDLLKEE